MADEALDCRGYEKIPVSRLAPGEMGVLLARAGAGKTACLTHLAIGYLLNSESVLHVCVDLVPDKVKLWYHELLKDIFSNSPECKASDLEHFIQSLRFIMSFLNQTFSPEKLETSIENLKQQAKFVPSLIILDGMDFGRDARPLFEKIGDLAKDTLRRSGYPPDCTGICPMLMKGAFRTRSTRWMTFSVPFLCCSLKRTASSFGR